MHAEDFRGWGMGARFYPVLYALTRMGGALDWATGLPIKAGLLGKNSRLHLHHIFPKARLYEAGYSRPDVNAVANYCFLTQDANLSIGDRLPEQYFPEIEARHPGALASQWIPDDPGLWKLDRYFDFLEARRALLAEEANQQLKELLRDCTDWLEDAEPSVGQATPVHAVVAHVLGGLSSEEEEARLHSLNEWVAERGYARGEIEYELADPASGQQLAVLDLAWPEGIQPGLSEPVAVLCDEPPEVLAAASATGFRCFTSCDDFQRYVLDRDCGLLTD